MVLLESVRGRICRRNLLLGRGKVPGAHRLLLILRGILLSILLISTFLICRTGHCLLNMF